MKGNGVGNGNGFVPDWMVRRQFTEAFRELVWQRDLGRMTELSPVLLTPEGLRKIVALITRTREIDTRDLVLLSAWVEAYRESRP